MVFLGMVRKPKPMQNNWMDPVEHQANVQQKRKQDQITNMGNYLDAKEELLEEMEANEGATIMEDMIKERRDWITEYRKKNLGKIPDEKVFPEQFHKRFDVETPEEIAAREAKEEEDGGKKGKKGGKKDGGAKGKKGGKKKKKGDDDDGKPAIIKIGPPETVQKFEMFY